MSVSVSDWNGSSVPMSAVTTPAASLAEPWLATAETKVSSAGRVSVICTPVAVDGPKLTTLTV